MESEMPVEVSIEELIPHSGQSVLLDRVIAVSETQIHCEVMVKPGGLYIKEGGVGASICIEWMAQAIAAYAGFHRRENSEPIQVGFLVSCRCAELLIPWLEVNQMFTVRAKVLRDGGMQMGSFKCEVLAGDAVVARATLNVYQGPLSQGAV